MKKFVIVLAFSALLGACSVGVGASGGSGGFGGGVSLGTGIGF